VPAATGGATLPREVLQPILARTDGFEPVSDVLSARLAANAGWHVQVRRKAVDAWRSIHAG
jgi:hypothetical protein